MGWSLLHTALRPFKIYCAPPNLGTRTWICRLNFDQRPIFQTWGSLTSLKSPTRDPQLKVPSEGLVLRIFTSWKNPSTSVGFEPWISRPPIIKWYWIIGHELTGIPLDKPYEYGWCILWGDVKPTVISTASKSNFIHPRFSLRNFNFSIRLPLKGERIDEYADRCGRKAPLPQSIICYNAIPESTSKYTLLPRGYLRLCLLLVSLCHLSRTFVKLKIQEQRELS